MSVTVWLKVKPFRHGLRAEGSFVEKECGVPYLFFRSKSEFDEWVDAMKAPSTSLTKGEKE